MYVTLNNFFKFWHRRQHLYYDNNYLQDIHFVEQCKNKNYILPSSIQALISNIIIKNINIYFKL